MRVCLVYDCLFPHTVGGAERWYRSLAERLAADGHEVTYLTLRQWERGVDPGVAGVDVRAVGPAHAALRRPGQPPVLPPLVFGAGVLWHLLRHGRRYDVVHTCSFPYFSLLAAAAVRLRCGATGMAVDWFEVWSRSYWREYLGRRGRRRRLARAAAVRAGAPARILLLAALRARLREEGLRGRDHDAGGRLRRPARAPAGHRRPSRSCVFAGRHIPEKRVPAIVPAIARARTPARAARVDPRRRARARRGAAARERAGPRRTDRRAGVRRHGDGRRGDGRALCLLLPSQREGYGLVVVEAAARGTPSVVVAGEDNAAVELIDGGRERLRRAVGIAGRPGRRDRAGQRRRAPRCAGPPRTGSPAMRSVSGRPLAGDRARGLRRRLASADTGPRLGTRGHSGASKLDIVASQVRGPGQR